ncbi:hypothetical protein [Bowmanella pacifica]|uniref:Uncharacterized protein n=1 Tax=Bowmanella pacifica TaxID=502051 RepID=A0A917Z4M4_9ALTE|nr:hypothetical protein [Bowmanella pacifica]GGO72696.1 hypothetical protein GCM10010982_31440 [Bowmanella pacifica]
MSTHRTVEVFGIHKRVESYVDRTAVDDLFKLALQSEKQIIVYGASKQGKTALVTRYCKEDDHITYQLTPDTDLIDIYQHIIRSAGIGLRTEYTQGQGQKASLTVRAKIIASFAIFGKGEAETNVGGEQTRTKEEKFKEVPFNIGQPQDIAELLEKARFKKPVILENFHYLPESVQKRFSFDLRAFQELGVRFIILGVWRERNRLLQFNGDLLDRVQEIPVEPWEDEDFIRIVKKGEELLNIKLSEVLLRKCIQLSFSSVGVFQDMIKGVCLAADVSQTGKENILIDNVKALDKIVYEKTNSYGDRHKRSFESIASATRKTNVNRLYYHIVDIVLEGGFPAIEHGLHLNTIYEKLHKRSRGNGIKTREVKKALASLNKIQSDRDIMPPILCFDENSQLLTISDSTLYFYLKNAKLDTFREQLYQSCGNRI